MRDGKILKPVLLPARCGLNIIRIKRERTVVSDKRGVIQLAVPGRAAEQVSATESVEADPGSCADLPVGRGSSGVKAGTGTVCGKLARRGLTSGTMIIVPGTKHEIYGSGSRILRGYWKRIFAFLEEPQVGKEWFGEIIKIQGNYSADSIGNTGKKKMAVIGIDLGTTNSLGCVYQKLEKRN